MAVSQLPRRWPWLVRGFVKSVRRKVGRHFHSVSLSLTSSPVPQTEAPMLVVLNHPSWWDPLMGTVLFPEFPRGMVPYAAIEETMLQKYWVFKRLGFFGVEINRLSGAVTFLQKGEAILTGKNNTLWVTAQGAFTDVRARPFEIRSGVGHLAARCPETIVIPVALEYTYWNEPKPRAFARIGPCMKVSEIGKLSGREWTQRIAAAMEQNLDLLNAEVVTRDSSLFRMLVGKPT